MQTNPSFQTQRTPAQVADDILDRLMPKPSSRDMPIHRKQACATAEGILKRAKLNEIFKSWGTPKEIAHKAHTFFPRSHEETT